MQGIHNPSYFSSVYTAADGSVSEVATMVVSWKEPTFNGACPVLSYTISKSTTSLDTSTVPANTNYDDTLHDPTDRRATFTSLGETGKYYAFKLSVTTALGTYTSEVVAIKFATVPPMPGTSPQRGSTTSSTQVTVTYSSSSTGGSAIQAYHLQYGVGLAGGFSDLVPASSYSMATQYILENASKGQTYYFRFRAKNQYGWGQYSSISYITASEAPAQPDAPEASIQVAADDSIEIHLSFDQDIDNMGSTITGYTLMWAIVLEPVDSDFIPVTDYTDDSDSFVLPSGTFTITEGNIYHFKYAAENGISIGEYSSITSIAAAREVPSPTGLARNNDLSSGTQITLLWSAVTSTEIGVTPAIAALEGYEVLGYRLYVLDSSTSQYVKIFDGEEEGTPDQTTFSYTDISLSSQYTFKVSVLTYNGESSLSSAVSVYACAAPSGMTAPTIEEVTTTSIKVSWNSPVSTGGCPLVEYAIYFKGSADTEFDFVKDVNSLNVISNDPNVREYDITDLTEAKGSVVQVKIQATNSVSSAFSPIISVLIAVPPVPDILNVVEKVDDESDQTKITVQFTEMSEDEANGSDIINYSLEYRQSGNANFMVYSGTNDVSNMQTKFTISYPLVNKGTTYNFRFRAKNEAGWGDYSSVTDLTVIGPPGKPAKLEVSSFDSTEINVVVPETTDAGGAEITSIDIRYASGLTSTTFSVEGNVICALTDATCGIDKASHGLTTGTIYKLKYRVYNSAGLVSDYSDELKVGLEDKPIAVSNFREVDSLSSSTQVTLTWDLNTDKVSPAGVIKGYRIYMVVPSVSEESTMVYDGYGLSKTKTFTQQLQFVQEEYRFTIVAMDFNGEGVEETLTAYACDAPSDVPRPQRVSSTSTQIMIEWGTMTNTGNCPIIGFEIYRDEGNYGDATILVNDGTSASMLSPSVHEATIAEFDTSDIAKTFKFRIRAYNIGKSAYSQSSSFVLAGIPAAPVAPTMYSVSETQIVLSLTALNTVAENGGSRVLTYEVAMETGGVWTNLKNTTSLLVTISQGIIKSRTYGFKVRAYNQIGAGPYSDEPIDQYITYIEAVGPPSTPDIPILTSVDATQISLEFTPSADDGGKEVTLYTITMEGTTDDTGTTTQTFTIVPPASMTLTIPQDAAQGLYSFSLIVGNIYTFSIKASNGEDSDMSEGLCVALLDKPDAPAILEIDRELSSNTSLYFEWSYNADRSTASSEITGYELQIDDQGQGNYETAFNGNGQPIITYYHSQALMTGATYNARVRAYNFNGYGSWTTLGAISVCDLPSGVALPDITIVDISTITIQWTTPDSDGGCSITDYSVYVAMLEDSYTFNLVDIADTTNVLVLSSGNGIQISNIDNANKGGLIKAYIAVTNSMGIVEGPIRTTILATIPDMPAAAPALSSFDDTQITLDISAYPISTANEPDIISFEIQWAIGKAGLFSSLIGFDSPFLAKLYTQTDGIVKGTLYRFKYRAKNVHGFGDFSPELQVIASTNPQAPDRPKLIAVDSTKIQLELQPTLDNGGSSVTDYKLYIARGKTSTDFVEVSFYDYATDGFDFEITKTEFDPAITEFDLVVGTFYRFRHEAINIIGSSDSSNVLTVAFADVPDVSTQSPTLTAVSKTSVRADWLEATSTGATAGDILGYLLYMDDGLSGSYSLVFNGSNIATVQTFLVSSLVTGYEYDFKYKAVNSVGQSAYSMVNSVYACIDPSSMDAPTAGTITDSEMTINWLAPTDNGG